MRLRAKFTKAVSVGAVLCKLNGKSFGLQWGGAMDLPRRLRTYWLPATQRAPVNQYRIQFLKADCSRENAVYN